MELSLFELLYEVYYARIVMDLLYDMELLLY